MIRCRSSQAGHLQLWIRSSHVLKHPTITSTICYTQSSLSFLVLQQPVPARHPEHESYSFMLNGSKIKSHRYIYVLQIYIITKIWQCSTPNYPYLCSWHKSSTTKIGHANWYRSRDMMAEPPPSTRSTRALLQQPAFRTTKTIRMAMVQQTRRSEVEKFRLRPCQHTRNLRSGILNLPSTFQSHSGPPWSYCSTLWCHALYIMYGTISIDPSGRTIVAHIPLDGQLAQSKSPNSTTTSLAMLLLPLE